MATLEAPTAPTTTTLGTTTLGMTRAFGSSSKSEFDNTCSHGFDMPSGQERATRMLARASTNPSGSRKLEYDGSRGRGLTLDGALALAEQLNLPQTNIEGLALRYIELSDEGAAALAEAIGENWTLARLELHGMRLSAKACQKFACTLARHPKLAVLVQGGGQVRQGTIPQHVYSRTLLAALQTNRAMTLTGLAW